MFTSIGIVILDAVVAFLAFRVWGQLDHGLIAAQVDLWSTAMLEFLVIVGGGVNVALIIFLSNWGLSGSIGHPALLVLGYFVLGGVAGLLDGVFGSRGWRKI